MKIALTGGTGHIGGLIARELLEMKHTVKALVRGGDTRSLDGLPLEKVKGDVTDEASLHQLMQSCDAVIHAAGVISIDGDQRGHVHAVNVEGTRKVMQAAMVAGVKRVIHISSIHAFVQRPMLEVLDEGRALTPDSSFAYDRSKRDGQQIALSYASDTMEVLVVNPTSVIGPYDFKPSKLGQAIIRMYRGQLPFVFAGGVDLCDGRDIAQAIANGLHMGKSGEVYLLGGKYYSLTAMAKVLATVTEKKINPLSLPTAFGWMGLPFIKLLAKVSKTEPLYTNEALIAVSDANRFISSKKAIADLNYTPRPLEETLRDTYLWFSKNGYLD